MRGPEEALARRPWRPPAPLLLPPPPPALLDEMALVSDSMSAARMAGSSDFHREEMSSGIVVADAMVVEGFGFGLWLWLGFLRSGRAGKDRRIFSQMAIIGDIYCGENGGKADEFHVYASVLIWSITDNSNGEEVDNAV
jgi:hypothetical protein